MGTLHNSSGLARSLAWTAHWIDTGRHLSSSLSHSLALSFTHTHTRARADTHTLHTPHGHNPSEPYRHCTGAQSVRALCGLKTADGQAEDSTAVFPVTPPLAPVDYYSLLPTNLTYHPPGHSAVKSRSGGTCAGWLFSLDAFFFPLRGSCDRRESPRLNVWSRWQSQAMTDEGMACLYVCVCVCVATIVVFPSWLEGLQSHSSFFHFLDAVPFFSPLPSTSPYFPFGFLSSIPHY